jgi:hypothetical protein
MTPVKPTGVSQDAALVYPGQQFGPGVGVQAATLRSIQSQIDRINNAALLNYERALSDWQINQQIDAAYHLPIPPQPQVPANLALKVTYSDMSGNIITDPAVTATGLMYAWVEEVYQTAPKTAASGIVQSFT